MSVLSEEQRKIVAAPVGPIVVTAGAGSGKTRTAVERLAQIRRCLVGVRGRVLLLSFSNVAVKTFRESLLAAVADEFASDCSGGVQIDTMDAFIASSVMRSHAHRVMNAKRSPFLVTGHERFLERFNVRAGKFPIPIGNVHSNIVNGAVHFGGRYNWNAIELDQAHAQWQVQRLGQTGAYTHELGRYWSYQLLSREPRLLKVLAHRYPQILVDESQDIGSVHAAILGLLASSGSCVSLIGDPSQGIYDFTGADGSFLRKYSLQSGVTSFSLTSNHRSVPSIVGLANELSNRKDSAVRPVPDTLTGTFFVAYGNSDLPRVLREFNRTVIAAGLRPEFSAVLCRTRDLVDRVGGVLPTPGQGVTKVFAQAAISRDEMGDYARAFEEAAAAVLELLEDCPLELPAKILHPARYPETRPLRRLIWRFVRDVNEGLPSATLPAATVWHGLLVDRVSVLLHQIERECALCPVENLRRKLAKTKLSIGPLITEKSEREPQLMRVTTVHQAKGETLDAVLYLTTKSHAVALLDGAETELGRIGYVAITRARNLVWLGVPSEVLEQLRPQLQSRRFEEMVLPPSELTPAPIAETRLA